MPFSIWIIQTIENAQKDVVNASNYYYLAEKGFTQSLFWLQSWKMLYEKDSDVDLIIIFAWNYSKMIIEKTQFKNYKYLVAFPNVQLVDSYDELKGFDSI